MATEKTYTWHKLADANEFLVAEGIILSMRAGDKQLCITQIEGDYFAFQSKCPHAGASFEHAWLTEKNELVCPLHRYRFDVRSGRNTTGEGFNLVRYPIKIDERGVWVGLCL
jgi:nitrite reductase/ring-hydroxylating ferredoxin subunit